MARRPTSAATALARVPSMAVGAASMAPSADAMDYVSAMAQAAYPLSSAPRSAQITHAGESDGGAGRKHRWIITASGADVPEAKKEKGPPTYGSPREVQKLTLGQRS